MKRRKFILILLLLPLIFSIHTPRAFAYDGITETIIMVTDRLDNQLIDKIVNNKDTSLGIMSTKTDGIYKNNSKESLFMTIALGKRVSVKSGLYKGLIKEDGKLRIKGYNNILNQLEDKYVDFSREIPRFGEYFKKRYIAVGCIGGGTGSLLAADKNGYIEYGEPTIKYDSKWLIDKTKELLEYTDILVVTYKTNENNERISILQSYIAQLKNYNVIIFPEAIKGDINLKWNNTLVPFVYKTPNKTNGIITSESTRRRGVITNLDIFPTVANLYKQDTNQFIGKSIKILPSTNPKQETVNLFKEFLNLNIIKYLSHGIVVIVQLYIIINYFNRRIKKDDVFTFLISSIVIGIFLSFVIGIFKFHRNILLYYIVLILLSTGISILLKDYEYYCIFFFSLLTNIFILVSNFFKREILYDSYIGYNNIVAGGRFYGLNNEIMGVLIATSIISFFFIKGLIKFKTLELTFLFFYFPIVIISLSSRFGANIGGYLTAVAVFLMMIYITLFDKAMNKRSIVILLLIGIVIFIANIFIDLNSLEKSHLGDLVIRTEILGINELIRFVTNKLKQLIFMIIVPPWSIILVSQFYFIIRVYNRNKIIIERLKEKYPDMVRASFVIFIGSIITLFVNDTGVIAFAYMNTYLISIIIGLHNIEKKDLF
ncbi:hypothetical protein [Caldisalinibacter kiritimatiensis]|uniref:Uncharacterized protein n=1 Tax=Caldisalinibacter kiritimatiensis TaxID=1304284 RepID=R1CD86_9FIRM|nr:hypothetical protein [Caldisalinibacter kiritimatiensis]EOD00260.1 hypothetical protein L21TH_1734 [Caldisalinibacter kiritimatiensis]